MTGLFETVRRAYLRATTYPAREPEWSTDEAVCAAQCGRPVVLGEPHHTVVRNVERVEASGTVAPLAGDVLAVVHIGCWPDENSTVVIETRLESPETAGVRRSAVAS